MATTDLKLEDVGTLTKPGPIGRLVRLMFGGACLYYVFSLWLFKEDLFTGAGNIRSFIWNGILPAWFLVSYIINIGFSRAWKKWPAVASLILIAAAAGIGYLQQGTLESLLLARTVHLWEFYLFTHLGLAFVLAAIIATPGCEMRAFHHLYSLITGQPTKEHHCPVGPLTPIDKWEASRRISNGD